MTTPTVVRLPKGRKLIIGGTNTEVGLVEIGIAENLKKATVANLTSAFSSLGDLVQIVEKTVRAMPNKPDKLEIEFGASLSSDCDLWIVSGEGKAEFKVKVSWEKRHDPAKKQ